MMRTWRFKKPKKLSGVLVVASLAMFAGCSDDDNGATTTTSGVTTTSSVTTTTSMGSNVESLSYLIQGLLTTEQIGGDWIDQGRHVIPPGSDQMSGFLCESGESAIAALEGRTDPQVSTTFKRPGDIGLFVSQTLMWADRTQLVEDFQTLVDAVNACDGATYMTSELGELKLVVDEVPNLGTQTLSFHFEPASIQTVNPWMEQHSTSVLLSDPNESVALVVGVNATVAHDPAQATTTELEPTEYDRIVKAAVDRIMEGL